MTLIAECRDCGFRVPLGYNSTHNCKRGLMKKLQAANDEIESLKTELVECQLKLKSEETKHVCD